jgi:hypothetical protein
MNTAAMTEADKDKIWDAIGKSCVICEVSTPPEPSKRKGNAMMNKIRPTFESLYEAAQDGTLAVDEDFPRKFWGIRSTNDEKNGHQGITLAHVAALAGRLPDWINDDSAVMDWKSYDGWTVRDAWNEGNSPSTFKQAGAI